jgi:hypothetical protein
MLAACLLELADPGVVARRGLLLEVEPPPGEVVVVAPRDLEAVAGPAPRLSPEEVEQAHAAYGPVNPPA